ncbi:MAG TPA: hypothetical protein VFZ78_03140 [Flavisolibacter sp.]
MDQKLKDILSSLTPGVDQETLLHYLQGKLTAEEQHEVEKSLASGEFESEAMEGLQQFSNTTKLTLLVDQLNRDLRKRTDRKRRMREKLRLKPDPWLLVAVILVLLLAVISYVIIHRATQH